MTRPGKPKVQLIDGSQSSLLRLSELTVLERVVLAASAYLRAAQRQGLVSGVTAAIRSVARAACR